MNSQTSDETDAFFDRLVLISNSVPKSGSTFLFSMQESLLNSLSGKEKSSFTHFEAAGVKHNHGFVTNPHSNNFIDALTSSKITGGPYVIKTHTLLNGNLRDAFVNNDNIFASLILRDPTEIFFSAKDNFLKTGEFGEFETVESGISTIREHFTKIVISTRNSSHLKAVPIVRYETIVADPIEALYQSLHSHILRYALKKLIAENTDITSSEKQAKNRFNIGAKQRPEAQSASQFYIQIQRELVDAREIFGYC